MSRGAYVLREPEDGAAQVVLIGTGSEVQLCLAAADLLAADGVAARVVSFPSWELFADQPEGYRVEVLPGGVPRLAVEAASPVRLGALRRRHREPSTTSGPRPPAKWPWRSSASPPSTSPPEATALVAGWTAR